VFRIRQTLLGVVIASSCIGSSEILPAQERAHAFVGAKILPVEGDPIEDGVLVVQGGTIRAIGPRASTKVPEGAKVVELAGRTILPGLICTHSHIGGIGGADSSAPLQPDVRIYDSINVRDSGFRRAVAGGLTTLNIMPGSGHLLSGQTAYVKLRKSPASIDDVLIRGKDGLPIGGMKMANGTNSHRDPPFPGTRGKSAALVRAEYLKAIEYREKIRLAGDDVSKRPPRDLRLEGLVEVLEGKRIVHHHTHRHDDIVTVLRLKKEFGFEVVLHHVSEGWKVAEQIAAAKAPCSIILIDSPGGKLEAVDLQFETGAVLEKAGVLTAFHTDDRITDSRLFLRMAAFGVRAGMSRKAAIEAVTLAGAKMLGLEDRIGSLRVGKDADFVILSGDPLSVYTKIEDTWVEGVRVFDRTNSEDFLHAIGGYGAGADQEPYHCCFEREVGAK